MRRTLVRGVLLVVGLTLIAAGLLLGLVPGVPGWPLALLGLWLLAFEFVWAERLRAKLVARVAEARDKVRRRRGG